MNQPVILYALERRQNGAKNVFLTKSDVEGIIRIKQGDQQAPSGRRRRGAGGGAAVQGGAKNYSKKVLQFFQVLKGAGGQDILCRCVKRSGEWRWCPVVPLEELPRVIKEHHERATGFSGVEKLYTHLAYNAPTELAAGADGKVPFLYGLEGFDRAVISIFILGCPVRADQAPLKPAEQPAPHPIVVDRAFQQCQVDLIDLGEGRDPKYRYIMSYVDLFTRHVWLRALASKRPHGVARQLFKIWMDTQAPARLQSDNGKEFVAGIILELCQAFGVTAINGAIGKPQSQGCVERSNRTVKDKISAQLQMAPTIAWRYQVRRVQGMINHEPAAALGRKMTRSQALFGEPSQRVLQAPAEFIARLLGIASDEEMDMEQGVDDSPAVPTTRTAARRPTAWAPITGRKRSAVEAELADEAEVAAAAAAMDEGEAPARRSSQRAAAAGLIAVLAMEHELEDAEEVLPMRQLPQRTAATSSPAGQRRNRIAVLAAAAAAAASEAGEEQAAAEAEEEQAAAEAEEEQAAAEAEEGGTLAAPHPPMPAHLQATRSRVAAAQVKNRQRIAAQRRPKGEPKDFAVGDDVLLLPPKRGKVGKQLGRNRIVCRVVEIKRPFGVTMYRLRSGAGVVEGMHQASRLSKAPPSLASELTFSGTAQRGVPVVSLNVAMAAQPGGGKAAVRCGCRGACTRNCSCKKNGLRALDLGQTEIRQLPSGPYLGGLKTLLLEGHRMTRLPPSLRDAAQLEVLDLGRLVPGSWYPYERNNKPSPGLALTFDDVAILAGMRSLRLLCGAGGVGPFFNFIFPQLYVSNRCLNQLPQFVPSGWDRGIDAELVLQAAGMKFQVAGMKSQAFVSNFVEEFPTAAAQLQEALHNIGAGPLQSMQRLVEALRTAFAAATHEPVA